MKIFILIMLALFFYYGFQERAPNEYLVNHVVDGDTFYADGQKIRIWGINAPEENQEYYRQSTNTLASLINGRVLDCSNQYKDKHKRDVMKCYAGEEDIGEAQVRAGMARDFTSFSGGYYEFPEARARRENLGIWAN